MPLHLRSLGAPTELIGDAGTPFKFSNTKHLALLAYLVLESGDYSREELTRFVWSSGDAGSMNDALSTLRAVFGKEVFPHRAQRIALDPELVDCDAARLLGARAGSATTTDVLDLYRGPFLEDFNERGAGYQLTRWVATKRKELESVFLTLCDEACGKAAASEEWDEVATFARRGLRHVAGWEAGARWLEVAEAGRRPPLPAASVPAPVIAGGAEPPPRHSEPAPAPQVPGAVPVPVQHGRQRRVIAGVAGLFLVAVVGVWGWREITSRSTHNGAELARPLCAPGEASGVLVDEVFYYGTRVKPGKPFRKAWVLQNIGGCTWGTDFRLHYIESSGERLSRTIMDIPLREPILPGQRDTFEVPMQAPITPGIHGETWQLRDGGDRPVRIGNNLVLRAGVKVPLPNYPLCEPGQGAGLMLVRKFPPGTALEPGARFRYSWTIKNTAECAWGPGTTLRFRDDETRRFSQESAIQATQTIEPDETYTFLVKMRAPERPGIYAETWELLGPTGSPIPVGGSPAIGVQVRVAEQQDRSDPPPVCGPGEAQIQFFDENLRDSTHVRPGQTFTKRWTLVNNGSCTWGADFRLRYAGNNGGQLAVSRADKPLGEAVPPETAYTFEVPIRIPEHRGLTREDWRFIDARGNHIMIGTAGYLAVILMVEEVAQ
jgi:hypothetical protein